MNIANGADKVRFPAVADWPPSARFARFRAELARAQAERSRFIGEALAAVAPAGAVA